MALTLADYLKLYGVEYRAQLTQQLVGNAETLLDKINQLLVAAAADGVSPGVDQISGNAFSSGWRPAHVNARTSNAGKHSLHIICRAGDLQDNIARDLAVWCIKNLPVLERIGLWMEDPRWTAGTNRRDPWVHVQDVAPGSGRRVFVPSIAPAQDPDFYTRNQLVAPR